MSPSKTIFSDAIEPTRSLATLHNEAEVTLQRDRKAGYYKEALERLLYDVERMTATVQGLLQLARADTLTKRPGDRLNLSALVDHRVHQARAEASGKDLTIHAEVAPTLAIAAQASSVAEIIDISPLECHEAHTFRRKHPC